MTRWVLHVDLDQFVAAVEASAGAGPQIGMHVKFDTGMCRLGTRLLDDALGLRALPGALRAQDEEVHRRKPS